KAEAFVTDEGGVTCHAAIVARELKKPCIIGTKIATQVLKDGDTVDVDANRGSITILNKPVASLSKLFSREKGVWYAFLWNDTDRDAFERYIDHKVNNNLYIRENEKVSVWYDAKERQEIAAKLEHKLATENDLIPHLLKDLNESWKYLGPYLKHEK